MKMLNFTLISVIKIQQLIKSPLLSFLPTAYRKRCFLKMIFSNLSCSVNFRKIDMKKPVAFTSVFRFKKGPPHRCFLVNFPNMF